MQPGQVKKLEAEFLAAIFREGDGSTGSAGASKGMGAGKAKRKRKAKGKGKGKGKGIAAEFPRQGVLRLPGRSTRSRRAAAFH